MPFILMAFWMSKNYFRRCSRPSFGSKRTSSIYPGMISLPDDYIIDSTYSGSWTGGGINSVRDPKDD